MAAESTTGAAGGDPSQSGDAGGNPDAMDEGVDAKDAGEGAATDSATCEATDSATGVATDSATEDNMSTSVEGDKGDHATEDGLSGPGDRLLQMSLTSSDPPKTTGATNYCKCGEICLVRLKN